MEDCDEYGARLRFASGQDNKNRCTAGQQLATASYVCIRVSAVLQAISVACACLLRY